MLTPFEIEQRSRRAFQASLPPGWTASIPDDDLGIDYWVQVTDSGVPTGLAFFVQLKGTLKSGAAGQVLRTERILQYLASANPVLLVCCLMDETSLHRTVVRAGWIREIVRDLLDPRGEQPEWWSTQQTVTIPLNVLAPLSAEVCVSQLLPQLRSFNARHTAYEDSHIRRTRTSWSISQTMYRYFEFWCEAQGIRSDSERAVLALRYHLAGTWQHEFHNTRNAIAYLERANGLVPLPASYQDLALCYESVDEPVLAIEAARKGIALAPDNAQAASNLGCLYFRIGALDQAVAWHEQAVRRAPGDAYVLANLASTLEYVGTEAKHADMGLYLERAHALFDRALQIRPNDPQLLAEKGLVLMKMYDFRRAIRALELAVAIAPDHAAALRRLARSYFMTRRLSEAHAILLRLQTTGALDATMGQLKALIESALRVDGARPESEGL